MLCCAVCQRGMYFTVDFSRAETSVCKVIFFFLILEGQSNKPFSFLLEIEIMLLFLDGKTCRGWIFMSH